MMRKILTVILLLLLLGYGLTGVTQIREGERGVLRRFGRVVPPPLEPGLSVGLPWGMDRVDRVAVDRVRGVEVGYQKESAFSETMPPGQLLTGDHNLVNVRVVLHYKVQPAKVVQYAVQEPGKIDRLLKRSAEANMANWVAKQTVDDVLLDGKRMLSDVLVRSVNATIEPYDLGVQMVGARVTLIAPPDEVKDSFDDVVRAQTRISTVVNDANNEAERKQQAALAEVFRIEQTTGAYADSQLLLAREEANRFLARLEQYHKGRVRNPHYLLQIWQEERATLFRKMKANGQIDLLDHHLGADGLDLITSPSLPSRR